MYVKLSRKRPDFEKLSRRACDGTRTIYSPLQLKVGLVDLPLQLAAWLLELLMNNHSPAGQVYNQDLKFNIDMVSMEF